MEPYWARLDHDVKIRLPLVLAVALVCVVATAVITAPVRRTRGYAPEQPIAFSHAQHAGSMRIACQYCHIGAVSGRHAGVPAMGVCMNCHQVAAVDSAGVVAVREAYERQEAVAWRRIYRLPDYAYFAHGAHAVAGVGCESCHGKVTAMPVVTQVHPLSMRSCLACHRQVQEHVAGVADTVRGPENCSACHR